MQKTTTRHRNSHASNYDLHGDLAKLKAILADTTSDVRGRAGEVLFQSLENMRNKSTEIQDNVSTYVADKPIKSIGVALLAGIAIGFLVRK
jgi:ElaB/YqjD/DUF883 family membrane-anchored ribosome-binding protein